MGWQLQTHTSAEIIFIYKFAGKSLFQVSEQEATSVI